MNRTSKALRRFGVPVLAATSLLTAGQIALGTTSAFAAAAANGTLTITPTDAYGTASPILPNAAPPAPQNGQTQPDQTVTYTTGTSSGPPGAAAQTINLSVSGSAQFVQPVGAQTAGSTLTIAAGGKTASCTTAAPAGGPPTTASCVYSTVDTVSELATVTATDATDLTTPPAQANEHFAQLTFENCPQSAPNTATNCVTQAAVGSQVTYNTTYLTDGQPAANVTETITVNGGANFTATQPAGTAFFSTTQVVCTTNAQGKCSFTLVYNSTGTATITATTSNTGNYPSSEAVQKVNIIPSTAAGRLVQGTEVDIRPSTQVDNVNEPGDAVQHQYTLYPCTPNTTTGNNACTADTTHPLSGVQVSLTVDHGFFTPNCTSQNTVTTNYANCTFDPAAATGAQVGNLKSLGKTITVTTDTNGQFTVTNGIGRDSAFDQNGNLVATITATSGGTTLTESQGTGNSPSGTSCPAAGCAAGTAWTTDAMPLNAGSIKIVSVPNSSTEPSLSDSSTNNIPVNDNNGNPTGKSRTIVVHLTDQFGNLTSGGSTATSATLPGLPSLSTSGVGTLQHCVNPGAYSTGSTCSNTSNNSNTAGQSASSGGPAATTSTDSTGTTTVTYVNVRGSYDSLFSSNGTPTQDRYIASNATVVCAPFCTFGAGQTGTQTLAAAWNGPKTTFNTFAAGTSTTPAIATYTLGVSAQSDTVKINWYNQNAQPVVTFSTTPSNTVKHGTVVTVSATVKDQFGNPIAGDFVQFVRSGPNPNNGTDCSATNGGANTNAAGKAGFSFTCNTPGTQVVTIVVQDGSGNELARGTQTIKFTGTTSSKRHITAVINCFSPIKHHVVCKVHVTPKIKGLTVKFRNAGGKVVGVDDTNRHGNAYFRKAHMKSGKHHRYHAHVHSSARTFGEDTGSDGVRVK